ARQPTQFTALNTTASSPALLLYHPGADPPRGALLAHHALIGSLPGFVASQNWFPQASDVFWSPTPWTEPQALVNCLFPVMYFGRPIVAALGSFAPRRALEILTDYRVTNTVLSRKELMQLLEDPSTEHYRGGLRALAIPSPYDADDWEQVFQECQKALGVWPNRIVGVPEAHLILGHSRQKWPSPAGSLGRPYPGHRVAVLDHEGEPCAIGNPGQLAIHREDLHGFPDPALFLGYFNDDMATRSQYSGAWFLTGVGAREDAQGNYWYCGPPGDNVG